MTVETNQDLIALKRVGKVVALALRELERAARPGMTTGEVDAIGAELLRRHGARSAPNLLVGFPRSICLSVNDEAVHGLPGTRVLRPGDLLKIDVTAELDGYVADAAITVPLPPVSPATREAAACAAAALSRGIRAARAGGPIHDIGRVIHAEVRRRGFSVIPELNGHGTGRAIWEEPLVPNYYNRRLTTPLREGQVIAIEPIISAGAVRVFTSSDGWTMKTVDGSLAAHCEHTVVVTRSDPIVLTAA